MHAKAEVCAPSGEQGSRRARLGGTMESKDLERIKEQLRRDLGIEFGAVVQLVKRWPAI